MLSRYLAMSTIPWKEDDDEEEDNGSFPELCLYFAFICITFHLHYICISFTFHIAPRIDILHYISLTFQNAK